ncbi:hypothetical protein [Streptomyces orinoci]|uniref:Secreted protein n=1 Tax=Streptomyces orinoci TaxID=67339 RepID=A0ABV3K0I0_STRON|nr:hypothetical protein [Streptomyces orinoci]
MHQTSALRTAVGPARSEDGGLRTEFDFELPVGYIDDRGTVHRKGAMRLATARDELGPLVDQRVRENPSYLGIVLLSLVIVRLGTLPAVYPEIVESLFVQDLAHLQDLYAQINGLAAPASCPSCGTAVNGSGGDRLGES